VKKTEKSVRGGIPALLRAIKSTKDSNDIYAVTMDDATIKEYNDAAGDEINPEDAEYGGFFLWGYKRRLELIKAGTLKKSDSVEAESSDDDDDDDDSDDSDA
jgi:hypothetical protein